MLDNLTDSIFVYLLYQEQTIKANIIRESNSQSISFTIMVILFNFILYNLN
jgi:hypothetical protein